MSWTASSGIIRSLWLAQLDSLHERLVTNIQYLSAIKHVSVAKCIFLGSNQESHQQSSFDHVRPRRRPKTETYTLHFVEMETGNDARLSRWALHRQRLKKCMFSSHRECALLPSCRWQLPTADYDDDVVRTRCIVAL